MAERQNDIGNTPVQLQPIAGLVERTFADLHQSLDRQQLTPQGLSYRQRRLNSLLPALSYDGSLQNAAWLQDTIKPFMQVDVGSRYYTNAFSNLASALEYASILEKGGLNEINARLEQLLGDARKSKSSIAHRAYAMADLNHLLYEAIYVFPHLATGVSVKLAPGTEGESTKIWETYGHSYGIPRDTYEKFRQHFPQKYSTPFPEEITVPLSYGYNSGLQRAGYPTKLGGYQENTIFNFLTPNRKGAQVPAVGLSLEDQSVFGSFGLTYFTLNEVESVKFVTETAFTPNVADEGETIEFVERENPVLHYLHFRDFYHTRFVRDNRSSSLTEDEWQRFQARIMTAKPYTNLTQLDLDRPGSARLKKGFIAISSDNVGEIVLCEMTDADFNRRANESAEIKLFADVLHGKNRFDAKTYKGMDIISRLMTYPVDKSRD